MRRETENSCCVAECSSESDNSHRPESTVIVTEEEEERVSAFEFTQKHKSFSSCQRWVNASSLLSSMQR